MWVMPNAVRKASGADSGERALALLGGCVGRGAGRASKNITSIAIRCVTERCIARVGGAGVAEIEERARAVGRARRAGPKVLGAAETAKRLGSDAYAGALIDMRAGTIQPWPTRAVSRERRSPPGAVIHTQKRRLRGRANGARLDPQNRRQGAVVADWVAVATEAYGGAPWPQGRREQIRSALFRLRHAAARAPICKPRSCRGARDAGTRRRS